MSDIFVKTSGLGSTGWRKASNIFVKTSGLGSTGWRSAVGVWIRNATQWLKAWPLSGIFATRVPYIGYFSSDTYENRMPNATYPTVRIGDSYFGDNALWDLNGWSASSYTYRWKLYDQFGQDLGITLRSGTGSGWTSTTGEDQLPTSIWTSTNSTNADRNFLGFEVTANNSSNSQYNGLSVSTKIQVVREKPIISTGPTLSNTSPNIGSVINYSSGWNTTEAYKIESGRSTISWYRSTSSTLTESQLRSLTPIQSSGYSYTVVQEDNANYIYAMEEVFNSGTDFESLVNGVTAIAKTTSLVATSPNAFTYSLTNVSSVTTPSTPTQTRVSSTSNNILFEFASLIPEDTLDYTLNLSGPVTNAGNQTITILNLFSNNSDYQTTLTSSANNSNVSSYVVANGKSRTLQFNVSTTTGAQSWKINYTISSASGGNGTYDLNTNSMPRQTIIAGVSNPTVTINSVTAYSELNQTGSTKIGTAGSQTSLSSITKPTAFSTTSSSNYTFYVTPVIPTISIAANSGVSATAGTINWTSTNQASFSSTGTFSGTGTTATSITKAGLTASTTYTGTVTVTSSTGHTASANYSLTTSATPTWTITWNANGGTGGGTTIQNQGAAHTAPSPGTRNGFTFSQWRKPQFGGDPTFVANNGTFTPTANDAFWAQWTANAVIPTITMGSNTGVTSSAGTINWSSTNQSSFSSTGTFSGSGTTGTSISKTGLTASTTYTGTVTVTSSTNNTASANYSLTTSGSPFVPPTSPAPSWTSGGNFQRITGSSILRWYTDYPSISGSGSITGMDFEIRTTAGGGTLLASGTRAYPGSGSYPYSGGGTIWAFRCGTSDSDISYSSSARFARARVRMLGTNGTTYFGTWTGWI
jgi:hypothetical protein